jgi:hypothetical protein
MRNVNIHKIIIIVNIFKTQIGVTINAWHFCNLILNLTILQFIINYLFYLEFK